MKKVFVLYCMKLREGNDDGTHYRALSTAECRPKTHEPNNGDGAYETGAEESLWIIFITARICGPSFR